MSNLDTNAIGFIRQNINLPQCLLGVQSIGNLIIQIRLHVIFLLYGLFAIVFIDYAEAQQDSVCATVKIEIQQELTLERQAFLATMKIQNGLDTRDLSDVLVSINIENENGEEVIITTDPNNTEAFFYISVDSLIGIQEINGGGVIGAGTTAEMRWLIIPASGTGGNTVEGRLFFVGAALEYTLGGVHQTIDVSPDYIYVKPQPSLTLDYFFPGQVVADDPLTEDIEPAESFTLGVRVRNDGWGTAHNVSNSSVQPRIVENNQGLLIDYEVTGSTLNNQPVTPSLQMDIGDLRPNETSVGRWIMQSSLAGRFLDFSAEVTHSDFLGGSLTSLIEDTNTHLLIRDVLVDLSGRDDVKDYLAYEAFDESGELRLYESNGEDATVDDRTNISTMEQLTEQGVEYRLQTGESSGFIYARLTDPYNGRRSLGRVIRSNGKVLSVSNAWLSKNQNEESNWQFYVNVFDGNTGGDYIVEFDEYVSVEEPPVLQYVENQQGTVGEQISFLVEATDPNGTLPILSADPLPVGALFTDESSGVLARSLFDWTPISGQEGVYEITFSATDGELSASQIVVITVCYDGDSDCDGIDNAWELEHFGTLDRDGTGDFDGDGHTDLDEYENDTDPTVKDAPSVPEIDAPEDGARVSDQQPELSVHNSAHDPNADVEYEFEVFSDQGLTELITDALVQEQIEGTRWETDIQLEDNQWYYWRVRACDPVLCSEWANARFFVNLVNDPPGPFHLSSPADGSEVTTLLPVLEITNSLDPDGDDLLYRFEVRKGSSSGPIVAYVEGIEAGEQGTTVWQVDVALEENRWYAWKVSAHDSHGATRDSEETSTFFVNSQNATPSEPSLLSPQDGETVTQNALDLIVSNASDADGTALLYVFELDLVDTFDSASKLSSNLVPEGDNGTTAWYVDDLFENTWYYWRVKSDDGTAHSAWVMGRFFVNTIEEPPGTPSLDNPGDGAWVESLRPVLSVHPTEDPDGDLFGYRFELYNDSMLSGLIARGESNSTEWAVDIDLEDNAWHYWRVQAEDEIGLTSDWTEIAAFFVNDNGVDDPPVLTLKQPAGDLSLSEGSVRIAWEDEDPDSNATIDIYYEFDIQGSGGQLIAQGLPEDPDGEQEDSVLWDISGRSPGHYHIFGRIQDATGSAVSYAPGVVTIGNTRRGSAAVSRTSQPDTTEAGVSSTFSVVLDFAPTDDVSFPIQSTNPDEGEVNPGMLVFTPENWSVPQTVTVTGVDDCGPDGDQSYQVQIGPAESFDPAFDRIDPPDLDVINRDNDPSTTHASLHICNYTLVGKVRSGRFSFDYSYLAELTNTGGDESGVTANVTSNSVNIQVIDDQVSFGPVISGATVLSEDVFTIRIDRRHNFDPSSLVWSVRSSP